MSSRRLLIGLALFTCGLQAAAQDDISDALEGFDDGFSDVIELADDSPSAQEFVPKAWSFGGDLIASASWNYLAHESSSGTDYRGLSKLRAQARLGLDGRHGEHWKSSLNVMAWYDAAYELNESDYSAEVLDDYQTELQVQDAWLSGRLGASTDIKLGRQLVVWGFADNLRVLDIINPLDNREPGLSDIEDLRLPSGIFKLDQFASNWQLSAILDAENRVSINPPYGSDFYSLVDANGEAMRIRQQQPEAFDEPGYAIAATGRFSGWDMSLIAAELWHDEPYLDATAFDTSDPNATSEDFSAASVLRHSRSSYFGYGIQFSSGSWLLRHEALLLNDLRLSSSEILDTSIPLIGDVVGLIPLLPDPGNPLAPSDEQILPTGFRDTQRIDWLLGLEYFGLAQTNIAVEISGRHLSDYAQDLQWSGYLKWRGETAVRLIRDFMNERLRTSLIAVLLHQDGRFWESTGGAIYRLDSQYDFGAGYKVAAGVLIFETGNQAPFNVAGENDRVFAELKYSF